MKNINRIAIGQININSIRNKFDLLSQLVMGNLDILLISETKLDSSFPSNQFRINGYSTPYRLDRNCHGGGILLYLRDDIPSRRLTIQNTDVESIFIEINLRIKKWLLCGSYNPHKCRAPLAIFRKHLRLTFFTIRKRAINRRF